MGMVATLVNLIWLMGCFGEPELKSGSSEKNDIILVSIDTLRADHLAVYGYERQTAPFIDLGEVGNPFCLGPLYFPWTYRPTRPCLVVSCPRNIKLWMIPFHYQRMYLYYLNPQASGWNTGGMSTLYVHAFWFQRV